MERMELLESEAEAVVEICRSGSEDGYIDIQHLVELCDYLEKSLLEEDGLEMIDGDQNSDQVFKIGVFD